MRCIAMLVAFLLACLFGGSARIWWKRSQERSRLPGTAFAQLPEPSQLGTGLHLTKCKSCTVSKVHASLLSLSAAPAVHDLARLRASAAIVAPDLFEDAPDIHAFEASMQPSTAHNSCQQTCSNHSPCAVLAARSQEPMLACKEQFNVSGQAHVPPLRLRQWILHRGPVPYQQAQCTSQRCYGACHSRACLRVLDWWYHERMNASVLMLAAAARATRFLPCHPPALAQPYRHARSRPAPPAWWLSCCCPALTAELCAGCWGLQCVGRGLGLLE